MTRQAKKANDLFISSSFGGDRNAVASSIYLIQNNAYQQSLIRVFARARNGAEDLNLLGKQLISTISQANAARQMDTVARISELMLGLPISAQMKALARYYQGVCLYHQRDFQEAREVFECAVDEVAPEHKGRVLHQLGMVSYDCGEIDAAVPFLLEALTAAKGYDPLTSLDVHWFLAIDRSIRGDHKHALADLENLFPLVETFTRYSGAFYEFLNSYAVELGEVGRIDEANAALDVALASPFAPAFPNWTRTRGELETKRRHPRPSFLSLNSAKPFDRTPQRETRQRPKSERRDVTTTVRALAIAVIATLPFKNRGALHWLAGLSIFRSASFARILTKPISVDVEALHPITSDWPTSGPGPRAPPSSR
ncbi:MAG: hypothetical protein DMF61_22015 [Blastocatellia bacterium AA13]|nr:MAG: hypothetical protein DMF61_22015 [Blastocatellia bacterium AA13]